VTKFCKRVKKYDSQLIHVIKNLSVQEKLMIITKLIGK